MFKFIMLPLCGFSLLMSAGCGLEHYQSSDLPPRVRLNAVKPGQTKEQVIRILGLPAYDGNMPELDPEGTQNFFLYAEIKKSSQAFLDPKEYEREIYLLSFDKKDVLSSVTHLTLKDAQEIAFEPKETPTGGKELSTLEQIVKNFGRYDAGGQDSTTRQ